MILGIKTPGLDEERKDSEFLSNIGAFTDEFAYDYKDIITDIAKDAFGPDNVDYAIYDFGSDAVDPFEVYIVFNLFEDENRDYKDTMYFIPFNSYEEIPYIDNIEEKVKTFQLANKELIKNLYKQTKQISETKYSSPNTRRYRHKNPGES